MGLVYDPRELPGVITAVPRVAGVLHIYNKKVSLFNQIYNQESSCKQSRANDVMVLETAKER
jgi:hypothetical protein